MQGNHSIEAWGAGEEHLSHIDTPRCVLQAWLWPGAGHLFWGVGEPRGGPLLPEGVPLLGVPGECWERLSLESLTLW